MTAPEEILTPRLLLRRPRAGDAAPMEAVNRDREVTRHLNRPMDDASIKAFWTQMRFHWQQHGFGAFAVESREPGLEGRFLGFVGVAYPTYLDPVADRPELGWRLARESWGRGLATEAAFVARDHALDELELPELVSIIHPRNERSRRVAEKLGMRVERQLHNPVIGIDVDVWALDARRRAY